MKLKEFETFLAQQLEENFSSQKVDTKRLFPVEDSDLIRKKLGVMGARKVAAGYERSEFFDFGRFLRDQKQSLRLYYFEKGNSYLSFCGRRKTNSKKQAELEMPVHYETMKRMLELIGFRVVGSLRQHLEEYELTFGKVWIKQASGQGVFIEIKGNPKTIESIARRLGLEKADLKERSVREITKEELIAV